MLRLYDFHESGNAYKVRLLLQQLGLAYEPFIAVLRFWTFAGLLEPNRGRIAEKREGGEAALAVMDAHLSGRQFFVDERYSIADIALFAYTHVAPEGGFDLARFPAVTAWIDRVRAQPHHVPITQR